MELSGYELLYFCGRKDKAILIYNSYELTQKVDPEALQKAVVTTLRYFPLFRTYPVLTGNGKIILKENYADPPIFPEDGTLKKLGTADTNGYLFKLSYEENVLHVCISHVLTDGRGARAFVTNLFYYYFTELGLPLTDNSFLYTAQEADTPEVIMTPMDYLEPGGSPLPETARTKAFHVPEKRTLEETPYVKQFDLEFDEDLFRSHVKAHGASPVTFMLAVISQSMGECYGLDTDISASIPMDLRGFFQSRSQANFSADTELHFTKEMLHRTVYENSICLRKELMEAREETALKNLVRIMREGGRTVEQIPFNNPLVLDRLRKSVTYDNRSATCILTNPGAVIYPGNMGDFILNQFSTNTVTGINFIMQSFRKREVFGVTQEWENDTLVRKISEKLQELGIPNTVKEYEPHRTDLLIPEEFSRES